MKINWDSDIIKNNLFESKKMAHDENTGFEPNDPPNFRMVTTCFICKNIDIQDEEKCFCKKYNNKPVYKMSVCDDIEIIDINIKKQQ